MAFELPKAVYSPELLESVVFEIQQYLDWYRQSGVKQRVGAQPVEEPTHSAETVLTIEAWTAGKQLTLESLEELITVLKGLKLPVVHITLAALPNHTQRTQLVDWFRLNTAPNLLLAFIADRNLGGGIVVRTPNHVFDYSWRQKLVEGRDKIPEIVRNV